MWPGGPQVLAVLEGTSERRPRRDALSSGRRGGRLWAEKAGRAGAFSGTWVTCSLSFLRWQMDSLATEPPGPSRLPLVEALWKDTW